jgi:hypothetical protein
MTWPPEQGPRGWNWPVFFKNAVAPGHLDFAPNDDIFCG